MAFVPARKKNKELLSLSSSSSKQLSGKHAEGGRYINLVVQSNRRGLPQSRERRWMTNWTTISQHQSLCPKHNTFCLNEAKGRTLCKHDGRCFASHTHISIPYEVIITELQVWRTVTIYLQSEYTRVGTLIVATIYLQLMQNRYMFRSFTVLQCSHQHCVQPVASDMEVIEYL